VSARGNIPSSSKLSKRATAYQCKRQRVKGKIII
jgi:hypothetical protein